MLQSCTGLALRDHKLARNRIVTEILADYVEADSFVLLYQNLKFRQFSGHKKIHDSHDAFLAKLTRFREKQTVFSSDDDDDLSSEVLQRISVYFMSMRLVH